MKKYFTVLFLIFLTSAAIAQTATVRGFVLDAESGEPVIFINVYLEGTNYGAQTDVNGYYSLTKVKQGSFTLIVSGMGYEKYSEKIELKNGVILSRNVSLKSSAIEMEEVTISGEKIEARTQVKMSVTSVSTRQITSIPSVGGQADIAQYMQVIPGIVFTGDQGGQLYVRGGAPVQNKITLDGMTITQPLHSIGLFSVFDNDIMKNADVFTGGFGAEYGGRLSSMVDVTYRDGNKYKTHGVVGASTFGAKFSIDGPIKKPKNADDGSITYVLSIKDSYLDQTSTSIYPYVNDGNGLPFDYTDVFGKISFRSAGGTKFNLMGFSFNDNVKFDAQTNLEWTNWGIGGNFVLVPSSSSALVQGKVNYSNYKIDLTESDLAPRSSSVQDFNIGMDMKYFIKNNTLKYGFDISGVSTTFDSFNSVGLKTNQSSNTTNLSLYGLYEFLLANDKLVINAGFRAIYYSSISYLSPEPRLGIKYNISPVFRIKASTGLYSQDVVATNSDRDVVNLFRGYVTSPESINDEIVNQDGTVNEINKSIQKASHFIFGFEFDVTESLNLSLEGYYKKFNELISSNRHKLFPESNIEAPDFLKTDFLVETGDAAGLDLSATYEDRKNFFLLAASLAKTQRWDGVIEYYPVYDRRFNLNLVLSRKFGNKNSWSANLRFNFGSGFPFTQTAGFYQPENLENGVYTDITTSNSNELGLVLSDLNQGRLPNYMRLDLGIKKIFFFKGQSRIEIDVSVTNVTDRKNVFYVNRITSKVIYQLPILPALGINFYF